MAGTIEPMSLPAAPQPSPASDKLRWWVLAVVVAALALLGLSVIATGGLLSWMRPGRARHG